MQNTEKRMDTKNIQQQPTAESDLTDSDISLTKYEVGGLKTAFTFADGHAYHDMPKPLQPVMRQLQSIWAESSSKSIPEMEEKFKRATSRIIQSPILGYHSSYSLCPTASNSIDITGAWLKTKGYTVGLIEPAFDNLYLLLKRRGVDIVPIQESDLSDLDILSNKIDEYDLKSLFIVSPNNPTGFQLDQDEFNALCRQCAKKGVTMIVDTTFRLYSRNSYDEYQILNDNGVDYLVIEDTGKTWPTNDLKVSLMAYSESLSSEVRTLYEEVYLCVSNFSLGLLSELIDKTRKVGIDEIVWAEVDKRKQQVREALQDTFLTPILNDKAAPLPLEWLDCSASGLTDIELVEELKKAGVALLPGRFFYWNTPEQHTQNVRLSLMRSNDIFDKGLQTLNQALQRLPG
jgi:aspartate/methionine/tyrosine aminotransferase